MDAEDDARLKRVEADFVISRACSQRQALHDTAVQRAVDNCLMKCMMALDTLYAPREERSAIGRGRWHQEPEPPPCAPDAWLRGAILEQPAPQVHGAAATSVLPEFRGRAVGQPNTRNIGYEMVAAGVPDADAACSTVGSGVGG